MNIQCPACESRYRIDISQTSKPTVRVKCPKCQHPFEVALPQQPAAKEPEAAPPDLLVVDDARFFREVVLDILKPLGLRTVTAGDGEEAMEFLRRMRPRLVIIDLKLPKMDGYQLIRKIRTEPALSGIRLLAMSSVLRQEDEIRKVMLAGADDFLNKSFTPQQLLQLVSKLLAS